MEPDLNWEGLWSTRADKDDSETLGRLHERLVASAMSNDLLDVSYRRLETPVGELLLAATKQGLVRVAYEREGLDDVLGQLAARVSPRILHSPARLDEAARELDDYFAGKRKSFELPLDFQLASGFRRRVLEGLQTLQYGETASYGTVARAVGNPKAVRAVGTACATNPLPIVVPCHRVVRSDGALGNYLGGPEIKRALLTLEGADGTRDQLRPRG